MGPIRANGRLPKAKPASAELRSEVEVVTDLAAAVLPNGPIDWRRLRDRGGFCVERGTDSDAMWGRVGGAEYRLVVDRASGQAVFSDGSVRLELSPGERAPLQVTVAEGVPDGHVLDVGIALRMTLLLDGVLDPRRTNPVNVAPVLSCPQKQGDSDARRPPH